MSVRIKLRRDTSANWKTVNPVPVEGEPCFETDTGKLKIGDGINPYNSLAYFAGGGGGGTTDITASLPLVLKDGVLKLQIDGQTLQLNTEGQLSANLDELGNEVNDLAGRVTTVEADVLVKEDKFTPGAPLIMQEAIPAAGLELQTDQLHYNSDTGLISLTASNADVYAKIDLTNVHIKVHEPYTLHLRAARYARTASGNSNFFRLNCFDEGATYRGVRVWNGSGSAKAGVTSTECKGLQLNSTDFVHFEFRFDGTNGISDYKGTDGSEADTTSLAINTYTDQAGTYADFEDEFIELLLNCYSGYAGNFDLTQSYIEQGGVKYILKDLVDGTPRKLTVKTGDNISVVDGALTATAQTPTNMVTTDTAQDITGVKNFKSGIVADGYVNSTGLSDLAYTDTNRNPHVGNVNRTLTIHTNPTLNSRILIDDGTNTYYGLHTGNLTAEGAKATTDSVGLVKPDGTSITVADDGTISAVNSGSGDVTAAGDNVFSGANTFSGNNTFTATNTFSGSSTFTGTFQCSKRASLNNGLNIMKMSIYQGDGANNNTINLGGKASEGLVVEALARTDERPRQGTIQIKAGSTLYAVIDSGNLGSYVDGTTVTYTDGKLSATGGSSFDNGWVSKTMVLTSARDKGTYTAELNDYLGESGEDSDSTVQYEVLVTYGYYNSSGTYARLYIGSSNLISSPIGKDNEGTGMLCAHAGANSRETCGTVLVPVSARTPTINITIAGGNFVSDPAEIPPTAIAYRRVK